jgi:hypothetical protein
MRPMNDLREFGFIAKATDNRLRTVCIDGPDWNFAPIELPSKKFLRLHRNRQS